jgi:hypothetical protein
VAAGGGHVSRYRDCRVGAKDFVKVNVLRERQCCKYLIISSKNQDRERTACTEQGAWAIMGKKKRL